MGLQKAKCTQCGGNLEIDDTKEFGFCPYCGTKYFTETITNYYYITNDFSGATIQINGPDVSNYTNLANSYIQSGNYSEALKNIDIAISHTPDNGELFLTKLIIMCNLHAQNGRPAKEELLTFLNLLCCKTENSVLRKSAFDILFSTLYEEHLNYSSRMANEKKYKFTPKERKQLTETLRRLKQEELHLGCFIVGEIILHPDIPYETVEEYLVKEYRRMQNQPAHNADSSEIIMMLSTIPAILERTHLSFASDCKIMNRKNRSADPFYIGTLLIHTLKQRFSSDITNLFMEIEAYMLQKDPGRL